MAYNHFQYEQKLSTSGLDATTSGISSAKFAPGYSPVIIRAFSCINTSTLASGNAMVAVLQSRTLTATTVSTVATINGHPGKGEIKYVTGLSKKISPGQEVQLNITTGASAAALLQWTMFVEPQWDTPANNTAMSVST
tara:strand:+ start:59 stop:472 length:414 start_codon:yes stop_codon:yes gene_type:complete